MILLYRVGTEPAALIISNVSLEDAGVYRYLIFFIVFYVVIGTLSHAKIILELLLQNNDKAKAFSQGGDPPSTPLLPRLQI